MADDDDEDYGLDSHFDLIVSEPYVSLIKLSTLRVKQMPNSDHNFIFHSIYKSWSYHTNLYRFFRIIFIVSINVHIFVVQMNIGKMFSLNIDAPSDGWKLFGAPMFFYGLEQNQTKFVLHTYGVGLLYLINLVVLFQLHIFRFHHLVILFYLVSHPLSHLTIWTRFRCRNMLVLYMFSLI